MSVDRAISKQPWGKVVNFMTKNLERAAGDMEIGQLPGVQHYLFVSRLSLLRPTTHEPVFQRASSSPAFKSWTDEFQKKVAIAFANKCESLLVQK
jgi:hypothetical protein